MHMFSFRAAGNRCAIHFPSLVLPCDAKEMLAILEKKNIRPVDVDMFSLARKLVESAKYRRDAKMGEAPDVFTCSTFVKWLYAQKGVWLPRYVIQQSEIGEIVERKNIRAGDLLFVTGKNNRFRTEENNAVSHVMMATGKDTFVHASIRGILEEPLDEYLKERELKAVRRILPDDLVYTLEIPPEAEVEQSDDLRWIILKHF